MNRVLCLIAIAAAATTLPAAAQTPTTPAQPAAPPKATSPAPAAPASPPTAAAPQGAANAPVPLPTWFNEIDTAKKGEVSRADFLKYRMKTFEQLDTNKDGKLSVDEFLKVAEPPYSQDGPGVPPLEERRARARAEFENLDTNRDGFVERAEAEALVQAEFNQYDTNRDNKITEPELRLIVQQALQRAAAQRQQAEAQRRQGLVTISDFIDMQLREADKLDKSGDGKVTRDEFVAVVAGPPDGPQAKGLPPYDLRRQIALRKFQEIDTNKDGILDRVELTAHAVEQFMQLDLNKDRFLNEDEFKKAQEAEGAKLRALVQTLAPAQQAPRPAPAPAPAQPRPAQPAAPQGLAPGLPQGTR
ncbi:Ca2+-binding protein, EF-hand superfamily [Enhydrobacter aerosaccus]|uniref:Ca2+-binding protein, EF-hand superfamily n=1 Tax=Enhydrobacter aerosaccus TaxID=225324 RepID=A0A1T4S0W2_9HYPH|nr:EF-hand domain-containing protein [Enhydrobacter aerosaccus]SKA21873.1 Ca2+-binding protein, EF-hand superfamily [Enhydrobacter aerosaccus]